MATNGKILCIGEVLWDALPAGLFLGGAPLNVACHLHEMGETVCFASRIGNDELGREIIRRMERRGLEIGLVQKDPDNPTGFVCVTLDSEGSPKFEIMHPSAWDAIEADEELLREAKSARALVFGSLAQRDPRTRETVAKLRQFDVPRVFDVNFRPPFVDQEVVEESLRNATVVKLNDEELLLMAEWFGFARELEEAARALAETFKCETVCVTHGAKGAALLHRGEWHEAPGIPVTVKDAVGAGDAFLAGLLSKLLTGTEPGEALRWANALGAYVASQDGATPPHDKEKIKKLYQEQ